MIKLKGFLFIAVLLTSTGYSQMPTLSFRNYTTDDGLPSSQLYQVVQDKQGYLWFATDHGLSRYNGYEFTNYSSSDGLEDNTIFKLEFDKKDRLWMQSLSGKFFYLDNDKIYSFKYNDTIASIIKGSIPLGFCIDEANTIYFTSHKSNPMKIDTLGNITKLFEPTNNALYSKLFFLEMMNGKFLTTNKSSLIIGKDAYLFFYNSEKKLDSIFVSESSAGNVIAKRINENKILVTIGKVVFEFSNNIFKEIYTVPSDPTTIYIDKEGLLFINTINGVYKLDRNYKLLEVYIANQFVSSATKDFESGLWITTINNGLFYLPNDEIRNYYFKGDTFKQPLCLSTDFKSVFAGFWSGHLLRINTQQYQKIKANQPTYMITKLFYDVVDERLYISSRPPAYIYKDKYLELKASNLFTMKGNFIRRRNGQILNNTISGLYRIQKDSINIYFVLNQRSNCVFETKHNKLLIGSNAGVFLANIVDSSLTLFDKHLSNIRVDDINEFSEHLIYATRGKGLGIAIDDTVFFIDQQKGLCSNFIHRMVINKNKIYCASYNGISCVEITSLSPLKYKISNTGLSEGLPGNEIVDLLSLHDTLWVATRNAISFYSEKTDFTNAFSPRIKFTHFKVNNTSLAINQPMILSPSSNNISIGYEAISYRSEKKINYRIMLINNGDTFNTYTFNRHIDFLSLKPGDYTFSVSAMNSSGVWTMDSLKINFLIETPIWRRTWFLLMSFLAIIVGTIIIVRARISRIRAQERVKSDINKQIVELEIKALRAQMNPHFIFNVINSIQDYILKNDSLAAQRYLSKFAKLIRSILDNSVRGEIFFEEELAAAKLYVELEQQRFEGTFDFNINIDSEVEVGSLLIPSMILQPFLENAIKHGIRTLPHKGTLSINVLQDVKNLIVIIEDNGVGRAAAAEIYHQTANDHISYGSLITSKRVAAYNRAHNTFIQLVISDLITNSGLPRGTRVELTVPKKYTS
jgi:hypothetical protein